MSVCGLCAFYLKRGDCPNAVYKRSDLNRVACNYNDKPCNLYEPKFKVKQYDQTPLPFLRFNGPAYDPKLDRIRLTGQIKRIFDLMHDGVWRTLGEIEFFTHDPQASISAQLRHLRKPRFGGYVVLKRRRGEPVKGLWEYCLEN